MVQREDVDFDPKHIDENFMSDEKNYPVTGEKISDGDLIFALKSSGLHSNGFTTVRKIIKDNEIDYEDQFPGDSKRVADVLLEPTMFKLAICAPTLNPMPSCRAISLSISLSER